MSSDFLRRRPRLRRMVSHGARRLLDMAGDPGEAIAPGPDPPSEEALDPPPPGTPEPDAEQEPAAAAVEEPSAGRSNSQRFERAFDRGWLAQETSPATSCLYERLDESDVAAIEQLIAGDPDLAAHYAAANDPRARRQQVLAYGIWLGNHAATHKTGLACAEPPEDIHVMARGPLAAAGGLYEADLVAAALASVGVDIGSLSAALDFGCSSGRVVRVLAAAYPHVGWHGCDPNEPAIAWAADNLPGVDFFVSGNDPPLSLAEGSLDLAYAISIWSHFGPHLGLRWFEEMRRVIRPGGHLICTTHGLTSVAHYATLGLRTLEQAQQIADAIYRWGCWYTPEFGEDGDWGVVNSEWGTAFLGPEWMLAQLCPQWRVLEFAPGRNQRNQDVYVLQRA